MQSDLKSLLELQVRDRAVMAIEEEIQALEPEIAELDGALQRLEDAAARAQSNRLDATTRREELEGRIETYRIMQERRRQKLEWVRGAKEASALMAEIDLARGVLAKEEAEWIRSADEVQEIEAQAAEAGQQTEAEKESQSPRRVEIADIQKGCHARLEAARHERERAAKGMQRNLLVLYDRIRRGRAPLAMYELHADACGHCFTSVPMHLRQQIKRGDALATCEACGVIMYVGQ